MSRTLLDTMQEEGGRASSDMSNIAIRFVVCTDGTTYCIGQGINTSEKTEVALSECSELVCLIGYDKDTESMEIMGRGPNENDAITLRYSIPFRDIIQIGYYNREEYEAKLISCWSHMANRK